MSLCGQDVLCYCLLFVIVFLLQSHVMTFLRTHYSAEDVYLTFGGFMLYF